MTTTIKRFTIGLLRLLIGVGFTFSLVCGVALTMLTLFEGTGGNLALSRNGLDWGWGSGAAIAWTLTLFWWICWRCLPAVKPAQLFPALERSLQKPSSFFGIIISTVGMICGLYLMLGVGSRLVVQAAGSSWLQFLWCLLLTVSNGLWAFSGWKQWRRRRQARVFVKKFYQDD